MDLPIRTMARIVVDLLQRFPLVRLAGRSMKRTCEQVLARHGCYLMPGASTRSMLEREAVNLMALQRARAQG